MVRCLLLDTGPSGHASLAGYEIQSIRLQNQRIETTKLDQTKNRLIALWQKIFIKHWV